VKDGPDCTKCGQKIVEESVSARTGEMLLSGDWHFDPRYACLVCMRKSRERLKGRDYFAWKEACEELARKEKE